MSSKNKVIQALEAEQMSKQVPDFAPGDTIVVQVKVKEGNRERLQAFEVLDHMVNRCFGVSKAAMLNNEIAVVGSFISKKHVGGAVWNADERPVPQGVGGVIEIVDTPAAGRIFVLCLWFSRCLGAVCARINVGWRVHPWAERTGC